MISSPGLPLPPSQDSPTAAIWFIWKFYPCFPSPSSRIQTTWVLSLMPNLTSASNYSQLTLLNIVNYFIGCLTISLCAAAIFVLAFETPFTRVEKILVTFPLSLPFTSSIPPRSSVFWCWLSALLLRRRSSPRNLLLWQLSQRCRRKSSRVSRSPKTISKTRKRWRVMLKAWRTQVEEATSLEKVLSSFKRNTCIALFDKWISEILRNMCSLRAGVLIETSLIRWPQSGMSYSLHNVHTCVRRAECPVLAPIWSQVSLSFPVINWQKVDGRRGITKANSNLRALCGPF